MFKFTQKLPPHHIKKKIQNTIYKQNLLKFIFFKFNITRKYKTYKINEIIVEE